MLDKISAVFQDEEEDNEEDNEAEWQNTSH
jgi:hypothetical protein